MSHDLSVSRTRWADGVVGQPAWSPDGSRIAFERDDGIDVSAAPGSERRIAATVDPGAPAWSPDGKLVAAGRRGHPTRRRAQRGSRTWTA